VVTENHVPTAPPSAVLEIPGFCPQFLSVADYALCVAADIRSPAFLSRLSRQIGKIAEAQTCKPSQVALWVLAQGEDIVPIPGTKGRQYLQENAAAADIVLTSEDFQQINKVSPQGVAAGARYPEIMMNLVRR